MNDLDKNTLPNFDVSITKTRKKKNAYTPKKALYCQWPGCEEEATCKAPKSPSKIRNYYVFCQKHASNYNKSWNFRSIESSTSSMHNETKITKQFVYKSERMESLKYRKKRTNLYLYRNIDKKAFQKENTLKENERKALKILMLPYSASFEEIKKEYSRAIKRLHPDMNSGKRYTEKQLHLAIWAYQILKKKFNNESTNS